jgi:hypothetical protein
LKENKNLARRSDITTPAVLAFFTRVARTEFFYDSIILAN